MATVSWQEMWGSIDVTERSTPNADGTVTMESWLLVPDGITMDQLICVANHLSWTQGNSIAVDLTEKADGENFPNDEFKESTTCVYEVASEYKIKIKITEQFDSIVTD